MHLKNAVKNRREMSVPKSLVTQNMVNVINLVKRNLIPYERINKKTKI